MVVEAIMMVLGFGSLGCSLIVQANASRKFQDSTSTYWFRPGQLVSALPIGETAGGQRT